MSQDRQPFPHQATTASTGVESTYYGQAVIKAPHWRWLVITYFFVGGIAGGTFIIGTVADLLGSPRRLVRAARYLTILALLPSPPLLILDLGRPERFLNMLRILKLRSPMSLGSWALSGLSAMAGLAFVLEVLRDLGRTDVPRSIRWAVGVLGFPFAVFMTGYTGVLLAITNIPLWARNYLLMGPMFVASSFSTSFAAITLALGLGGGEDPDLETGMARAEAACLASEWALITAGLVRLGRLGRPLTAGRIGRVFWPVIYGAGLAAPLALQLAGPVRGQHVSKGRRTATAVMVLIGGYTLRAVMIFAGRESARRPEDYFAFTATAGAETETRR